jgi:type VI secretion system ImpA family protein
MDIEKLIRPIPYEGPCGRNLEDTQVLLSFDAYRIFNPGELDLVDDWWDRDRDWHDIKTHALEALQQSKDLRLLAYLGAAVLRTDGLHAYAEVLTVAAGWLRTYWEEVYPLLDEDGIARRSALMCLTDSWAIYDRLRRTPMVTHEQLGPVSLRDLQIMDGDIAISEDERLSWDEGRVRMVVRAVAPDTLLELHTDLQRGMESLTAIKESMASRADLHDTSAYPWSFSRVAQMLQRMTWRVSMWQMIAGIRDTATHNTR